MRTKEGIQNQKRRVSRTNNRFRRKFSNGRPQEIPGGHIRQTCLPEQWNLLDKVCFMPALVCSQYQKPVFHICISSLRPQRGVRQEQPQEEATGHS